jgi:hypothetical protein
MRGPLYTAYVHVTGLHAAPPAARAGRGVRSQGRGVRVQGRAGARLHGPRASPFARHESVLDISRAAALPVRLHAPSFTRCAAALLLRYICIHTVVYMRPRLLAVRYGAARAVEAEAPVLQSMRCSRACEQSMRCSRAYSVPSRAYSVPYTRCPPHLDAHSRRSALASHDPELLSGPRASQARTPCTGLSPCTGL